MAQVSDYLNLITSQFQGTASPKFNAMVQALVTPLVGINNLVADMPNYFQLETARGRQLETIGAWVGQSRYINFSLEPYIFTWLGTIANGWQKGFWAVTDGNGKPIVNALPDFYYRAIIKAKINNNMFKGSLTQCQTLLRLLLADSQLLIADNQNMSFSVLVAEVVDPVIALLIANGYFDLRPFGVRVIWAVGNVAFAWDTNMTLRKGWDQQAKWFA